MKLDLILVFSRPCPICTLYKNIIFLLIGYKYRIQRSSQVAAHLWKHLEMESSIYIELYLAALWSQTKQVVLPLGLFWWYPPLVNHWKRRVIFAIVSFWLLRMFKVLIHCEILMPGGVQVESSPKMWKIVGLRFRKLFHRPSKQQYV